MASKRSINQAFEITNNLMCSSCSKRGNRVKAVKFCEDCLKYLCSGCVHDHNKFDILSGHTLLDDVEMRSLRTDLCKFHPRNIIDRYCWYHDVVCCQECESKNHSVCIGIDYLPAAAKRMKTSEEYKCTKSSMQDIKLKLVQTKKAQEEELGRLEQEKDKNVCEVQEFTNRMINHLTDLEKKKIDQLYSQYKKQKDEINDLINVLDANIQSVDEKINQIKTFDGETDEFLFVNGWKDIEEKCQKQIKTNQERVKKTIRFKENDRTRRSIQHINSIGTVTSHGMCIDYSASFHGHYKLYHSIMSICQLYDGTIITAIAVGCKLVRFNRRFKERDQCDLPGSTLYGNNTICTVGTNEVAVALDTKIQFVTIDRTMTLSRSFTVYNHDDYNTIFIRSIHYMTNQLFVCGSTTISVFNKEGTPLRTIRYNDIWTRPFNVLAIDVSTNNTTVYGVSTRKGLFSFDVNSLSTSQLMESDVKKACVGPDDHFFVAENDHTILCISSDGSKQKVLLKCDFEIESLFYDKINSRLIVASMISDTINVYDLYKNK